MPSGGLLQSILPLRGAIQHYDWGSRTALAELLGRAAPSDRPEAELWLGAHPNGPAEVRVEGRWERLDRLIEAAPEALLGSAAIAEFGPRLPFLLKILAVERPLSLQAHPDRTQAEAGFAREQAGPPGAPRRYADPYAKPELVCALTPFRALCGFRPLGELRERLGALGIAELLPAGSDEQAVLAGFLGAWLAASPAARREPLGRALEAAERLAGSDPASACVLELARAYPDDPGVLAPLFLNDVELAPGEALFLPPGELHCYLAGVAVELMASSDNVLRGGLTAKPVDVPELLRVVRFASRRPPVLRAEPRTRGEGVWRTAAAEFELSLLEPSREQPVMAGVRRGIEILWCLEGELRVAVDGGGDLALGRGDGCLMPVAAGPYCVGGSGRSFRAALPEGG